MTSPAKFMIALLCLTAMACTEIRDTQYDNLDAAREAGAITRGWIPAWLPKDAVNITERHNIDTNTSALYFEIPNAGPSITHVNCAMADQAPEPRLKIRNFPVDHIRSGEVKICGDFYAVQVGQSFYLWQNG